MNTKTTVISEAQLQQQYAFCDKIIANVAYVFSAASSMPFVIK